MDTTESSDEFLELCPHATEECRISIRRSADRDIAIKGIQKDMLELKMALASANMQTKEIIEIYKGMKLLILILQAVGAVARWIAIVAAACGVIWTLWQLGVISVVEGASKHVGK